MEKGDTGQKDHDKGSKEDSVKGNRAWLWGWEEGGRNEASPLPPP
jgi:hypothetical protein